MNYSPSAARTISPTSKSGHSDIKWNEVLSLGGLHVAIAISLIAYLEYQPVLLQKFSVTHLGSFLLVSKALILVIVPVLSGWLTDRLLVRRGRFLMVFMIGISATAMIFMTVASLISVGPQGGLAGILPGMIILWLIGMSVFMAPALSMIERFTARKNLPVVMGYIVLITELIYALEPVVVELVRFFGETLTFIVGGVLVLGTGLLFRRLTVDEVEERTARAREQKSTRLPYQLIILTGLILGAGRAFLVEYLPQTAEVFSLSGKEASFLLLALSAVTAFLMGRRVARSSVFRYLKSSLITLGVALLLALVFQGTAIVFGGLLIIAAIALGIGHVSGLPLIFNRLTPVNTTLGIGLFLGVSAITEGIMEVYFGL